MNAALPKLASESASESATMPIALISSAQIKQAFTQAQAQQRRVIDVLEELNEQNQEAFLQSISQTMHFNAISMREINSLRANFDVIPFALALTFYYHFDLHFLVQNQMLSTLFLTLVQMELHQNWHEGY